LSSIRDRRDGYRDSLAAAGLPYDDSLVLHVDDGTGRAMGELVGRMLRLPDPPTAAFCANDVLAVGMFTSLQERSISVPEQFSVAGFDALELLPSPQTLTSVRRPTAEMGRQALRLLVDRIRQGPDSAGPVHVVMPTELVAGDTAAPPTRRPTVGERRRRAVPGRA
jgi:DNA-binding LacI/PurR family transcriptional regulator